MKYAFINGIILDGTENMAPISGKILVVDGERIEGIFDTGHNTDGCRIIDLNGSYIMPGLINLHIHTPSTGKPKKKETDAKKLVKILTSTALTRKIVYAMCKSSVVTQLMSGVTTVRTVGGVQNVDSMLRDDINAGKFVGPRVLAGNMAVSVPGGHMAGSLAYEAVTPEDAVKYVDIIARDKPDLIKLMITGGVLDAKVKGEPGVLRMAPELVKAACDEAHRLGLYVAAHVESPEGVRVALENGVDTIEHGAEPDEEIIRLFKERGAAVVTTLSPALPYALFDLEVSHATEMSKFNGKVVMDGIISCCSRCLAEHIPVGLGTDTGCPFITHYDMWRELNYFVKFCHVTPAYALHSATLGNARIVGIADETGSVEAGKCADLIVTRANPLESAQALRNVSMVMARGRLICDPRVKKMANVERELDKWL